MLNNQLPKTKPAFIRRWLCILFLNGLFLGYTDAYAAEPTPTPKPAKQKAPKLAPEAGKAQCVVNIRKVQQALRVYQNMNGISAGDAGLRKSLIVGPKALLKKEPSCPSGGKYTWAKKFFPQVGKLMVRCSHPEHVPADHKKW